VKHFNLFLHSARYLFRAVIVFACFWLFGLWQFATLIPPPKDEPKGHYDAIIVLTGGKERIPYALELLRKNKAKTLFISGVADGFSFNDLAVIHHAPEGSVMAALRPRIFYGEQARDTIGNAEETLSWLKDKPFDDLLIVTANYHIPRTRLLFSHYLPHYTLTYASVEPPQFHRELWLTDANSLRLMISEYQKMLLTWVRLTVFSV
jgi:uncharacterized SAM-binding protein YcdF (DUF218 family)